MPFLYDAGAVFRSALLRRSFVGRSLPLALLTWAALAGASQVQATPAKTAQATQTQAIQTQGQVQPGQSLLAASPSSPYAASAFFADVQAKRVTGLTLQGDGTANVTLIDGSRRFVVLPPDATTMNTLRAAGP